MTFKTGTRKVKQSFRRFTDEQRKEIIQQIDGRPSSVKKSDMFEKFGMGHGGNLYYTWKEKFGMRYTEKRVTKSENVQVTKPIYVKTNGKKIHTVTLSVEVGSIMELLSFCNEIVRTPKVKSVLSVE